MDPGHGVFLSQFYISKAYIHKLGNESEETIGLVQSAYKVIFFCVCLIWGSSGC